MTSSTPSSPADPPSRESAKLGGQTRAQRMTPAERSSAARKAAEARWGNAVAEATHSGRLQIGDREIMCAVLEDGTRVVSQATLLTALGRSSKAKHAAGGAVLFANNLQPFVSPELDQALRESISYALPTGGKAVGYRADLLPSVCEVYLDADAEGKLLKSQQPAKHAAEILLRGLARVGVTALIDEATGYQEIRARNELQRILDAYIQTELRPWVRMFPDEFFQQIYRLQGWDYKPGTSKRTPYVGHLVNKYIYDQLPPGVLDELRAKNPRNANGNRSRKHHQLLTADTGIPHLDKQILTVTTLMRISDDKAMFESLFERAFPPMEPRLPLDLGDIDSPGAD
jgi:hypothetical protein